MYVPSGVPQGIVLVLLPLLLPAAAAVDDDPKDQQSGDAAANDPRCGPNVHGRCRAQRTRS